MVCLQCLAGALFKYHHVCPHACIWHANNLVDLCNEICLHMTERSHVRGQVNIQERRLAHSAHFWNPTSERARDLTGSCGRQQQASTQQQLHCRVQLGLHCRLDLMLAADLLGRLS